MQSTGARITVAVATLLLAAGAAWQLWPGRSGAARDFPDGIRMLCTNPDCRHPFDTTLAGIAAVRAEDDDAPVPCPECAGPAERGTVCPSCDGTYLYGSAVRTAGGDPACPLCKAALPKLAPGG